MSSSAPKRSKAEQTRAQILGAAERRFAEHGFSDTRLEDVAEDVGLRRAALFYHFRDKRALYDAVLVDAFGELMARVRAILARPDPIAARLEATVEEWVDSVAARPAIAHFILREAADSRRDRSVERLPEGDLLLRRVGELIEEGVARGELNPVHADPFHVMSAVAGSTVFYVAAFPALVPSLSFDPLAPEEIEAHKRDVVRTARRLLGVGTPRVVGAGSRPRGV